MYMCNLKNVKKSCSRKSNPLNGHCTTADLHFIYYNKHEKTRAEDVLENNFSNRDFGFYLHFDEN